MTTLATVKINTAELDRIVAKLQTNTAGVIEGLGREVEARAKQFAPVDTGALRASIASSMDSVNGAPVAIIGPSVEYGIYVELGTYKMGAQPYLLPALQTILYKLNSGILWQELV